MKQEPKRVCGDLELLNNHIALIQKLKKSGRLCGHCGDLCWWVCGICDTLLPIIERERAKKDRPSNSLLGRLVSAVDEEIWPRPPIRKRLPPDTSTVIPFSDFTKSGAVGFPEVVQPIYDEINELYDTDYEPIFK